MSAVFSDADLSMRSVRSVHALSPQRYSTAVARCRAVERYVHKSPTRDGSAVLQRQKQQQAELISEAESLVRHRLSALQLPLRPVHGADRSSPSKMGYYTPGPRPSLRSLTPMSNTHHINQDSSLMRGWW